MGYKGIIQILLILALISTICICIIKPKMHAPLMVYNSDYEIVQNDASINIEENNIPILVQNSDINSINNAVVSNDNINILDNSTYNPDFVQTTPQVVSIQPKFQKTNTNISPSKSNLNNVKTQTNNIKNTPVNLQKNNTQISQPQIDINKIIANNQNLTSAQQESIPITKSPQPITKQQPQTQLPNLGTNVQTKVYQKPQVESLTTNQPIILTAQEEEIAWNKWRSNLNNQIMRDVKLPTIPNGIIFKYKFTVDKYGKVSNVQTWSATASYTPYAIEFIAPIIRSYQGRSILNFPTGSNRYSTEVSGAWKISNSEKYSSPSDYNDIEKIKK